MFNCFKIALLLFAFSALSVSNASSSTIRYFRHASLNGRHQFVFSHELHGNDTGTCKCYRVSYDDQSRVTEWSFLRAGILAQDPVFTVAKTDISYDGLFTTFRFFQKNGRRDQIDNGHYGEKFKMDVQAKLGTLYPYDQSDHPQQPDGNGVYRYNWVLDDKGNVMQEIYMSDGGVPVSRNDGVFTTKYLYDDSGRQIEEDHYGMDGKLVESGWASMKTTCNYEGRDSTILWLNAKGELLVDSENAAKADFEYDEQGYLISKTLYDSYGGIIRKIKWTFDERGNMTEERSYGPDESLVTEKDYTHNAKNLITDIYKRDQKGRIRLHTNFQYNSNGDPTQESYSDSTGKLTADDDSYSMIKTEYDDHGLLLSMQYIGPDGNPIGRQADSVAYIYRKYNSTAVNMETTEIRCLDANKNLHESSDYGAALIKISYDSDGEITEVHRFDRNEKEIAQK